MIAVSTLATQIRFVALPTSIMNLIKVVQTAITVVDLGGGGVGRVATPPKHSKSKIINVSIATTVVKVLTSKFI